MNCVHALWHDDLKFLPGLVKAFSDGTVHLEKGDVHRFVTPYSSVYEAIKQFPNTELYCGGTSDHAYIGFLNAFADHADWLILHGAARRFVFLGVSRRVRKKLVYRTWGGRLLFHPESQTGMRGMAKRIASFPLNCLLRSAYLSCRAIGVANAVDELHVSENIGEMPMYPLGYFNSDSRDPAEIISNLPKNEKDGDCLNVLLGHSGYPEDNHLELMERLSRYQSRDIRVYLVLSYGNDEYINEVEAKALRTFGPKARVIREMMPLIEYLSFLETMDVAILDGRGSSALGNLGWLVAMEKTIWVNGEGLYRRAMDRCGVPYRLTSELGEVGFESFATPVEWESRGIDSKLAVKGDVEIAGDWERLLTDLRAECR